jgi:hypothetical protein
MLKYGMLWSTCGLLGAVFGINVDPTTIETTSDVASIAELHVLAPETDATKSTTASKLVTSQRDSIAEPELDILNEENVQSPDITSMSQQLQILNSEVTPVRSSDLEFAQEGRIESFLVEENQFVEAGAILGQQTMEREEASKLLTEVRLRQSELRARNESPVKRAEDLQLYKQDTKDMTERLYKQSNAASKSEYARTVHELNQAKLSLEDAKLKLEESKLEPELIQAELSAAIAAVEERFLRAPYDGQIISINPTSHSTFRPEQMRAVIVFADLSWVRLRGLIPDEAYESYSSIRKGGRVKLQPNSYGSEETATFDGYIESVEQVITTPGYRRISVLFENEKRTDGRDGWQLTPGGEFNSWIDLEAEPITPLELEQRLAQID